jgi:hypothetical protein
MLKPGDIRSSNDSKSILIVLRYSIYSNCALVLITVRSESNITWVSASALANIACVI